MIAYTDGEVRRQFNICYTARITSGQLTISDESTEIRFVNPRQARQSQLWLTASPACVRMGGVAASRLGGHASRGGTAR